MADSFIYYGSFADSMDLVPREYRLDYYEYLTKVCLGRIAPEDVPFPINTFVTQAMASVANAAKNHEKAVEDGKKGGRPGKYVEPEEWQAYYAVHSQKETAEHFNVSPDTIQRWIKTTHYKKPQNTAKPQNLNNNINTNNNVNANDNDIIISSNKKENPCGCVPRTPTGFLKEGEKLVREPYEMNGKYYATVEKPTGERVERIVKSS